MKHQWLSLTLVVVLTGCASGVRPIGKIGDTEFSKVHIGSFSGPNITALVTKSKDGSVTVVSSVGGAGIGTALIGAGATVGAATVFGGAIRPSPTTINNASSSTSTGGAAASEGGDFTPPGLVNNPGHNK
jgi:hypothetical protein